MNYEKEYEEDYLNNFLSSIRSNKTESIEECNKFKRLSISPLRYAGGKSAAIGLIFKYLPMKQYMVN